MTEVEKLKIKELRLKGIGYKAIATELGFSRDKIKSYCKRSGLEGDSKFIALNVEEKKKRNLLCAHCATPIKQKKFGRVRRFCSDACRRTWWSDNQDKRNINGTAIYKYVCPNCGREFSCYGNKKRKYCSHNCYINLRFWEGEADGI